MKMTTRVGIHVAAMTVACMTALAATPPFLDGIAPRMSSVLPRDSVAGTEGALSTITNPAALDARKEAEFVYLRVATTSRTTRSFSHGMGWAWGLST